MSNWRCPNCVAQLGKNKRHGENVYECKACGWVFLLIVTSRPVAAYEPPYFRGPNVEDPYPISLETKGI